MRISELSARVGVNPATLRAWERRYGVVRPKRTEGGQRDYDEQDLSALRTVVNLIDSGIPVSEAVRRLSTPPENTEAAAEDALDRLWAAVDSFDERATRAVLSETTRLLGIPAALDAVLVPTLRRLGDEWRLSPRNIAREHFTSTLARAHLVELLPIGDAARPVCLAFCPAGEPHDIGLVMAALTMAAAGFRPIVLGAQTPSASVDLLLGELRPSLILVGAATRRPALRLLETWRPPAGCVTVAGGGGFRPEDEGRIRARIHLGAYAALPAAAGAA